MIRKQRESRQLRRPARASSATVPTRITCTGPAACTQGPVVLGSRLRVASRRFSTSVSAGLQLRPYPNWSTHERADAALARARQRGVLGRGAGLCVEARESRTGGHARLATTSSMGVPRKTMRFFKSNEKMS